MKADGTPFEEREMKTTSVRADVNQASSDDTKAAQPLKKSVEQL